MRFSIAAAFLSLAAGLRLPAPRLVPSVRKSIAASAAAATLLAPGAAFAAAKVAAVDAGGDKASGSTTSRVFEVSTSTRRLPDATPPLTREPLDVSRKATAYVVKPATAPVKGGVVFLHGFSQQPPNYKSTLRALAAAGYEVVAPSTWLLDVVWPWVSVAEAPRFSPPGKLQTAIIVDGLRSVEMLRAELPAGAPIAIAGHSMGGACALVVPSLMKPALSSVFVESPAAKQSVATTLNPYLAGDVSDYPKLFAAYPKASTRVVLVSAKDDYIVSADSVKATYEAAAKSLPKQTGAALVELQEGSHVGFEDKIKVRLPFGAFSFVFNFLDFLLYTSDAFEGVLGNFDTQLSTTKVLLHRLDGDAALANEVPFDDPVADWDAVSRLVTADKTLAKVLGNPLQGRP